MSIVRTLDTRLNALRKSHPIAGWLLTIAAASIAFVFPLGLFLVSPLILGAAELFLLVAAPILLIALCLGVVKWNH